MYRRRFESEGNVGSRRGGEGNVGNRRGGEGGGGRGNPSSTELSSSNLPITAFVASSAYKSAPESPGRISADMEVADSKAKATSVNVGIRRARFESEGNVGSRQGGEGNVGNRRGGEGGGGGRGNPSSTELSSSNLPFTAFVASSAYKSAPETPGRSSAETEVADSKAKATSVNVGIRRGGEGNVANRRGGEGKKRKEEEEERSFSSSTSSTAFVASGATVVPIRRHVEEYSSHAKSSGASSRYRCIQGSRPRSTTKAARTAEQSTASEVNRAKVL
jgi:hypothetical protein